MDFVSNVMFWISNSLLVPVMVGLVLLFLLSLVMIGSLLAEQQKQRQKKSSTNTCSKSWVAAVNCCT